MQIEYSNNPSTGLNCFKFSPDEMKVLNKSIPGHIRKLEKKIVKIENDPNNEGQVTYWQKAKDLQNEIDALKEIFQTFTDLINLSKKKKKL